MPQISPKVKNYFHLFSFLFIVISPSWHEAC